MGILPFNIYDENQIENEGNMPAKEPGPGSLKTESSISDNKTFEEILRDTIGEDKELMEFIKKNDKTKVKKEISKKTELQIQCRAFLNKFKKQSKEVEYLICAAERKVEDGGSKKMVEIRKRLRKGNYITTEEFRDDIRDLLKEIEKKRGANSKSKEMIKRTMKKAELFLADLVEINLKEDEDESEGEIYIEDHSYRNPNSMRVYIELSEQEKIERSREFLFNSVPSSALDISFKDRRLSVGNNNHIFCRKIRVFEDTDTIEKLRISSFCRENPMLSFKKASSIILLTEGIESCTDKGLSVLGGYMQESLLKISKLVKKCEFENGDSFWERLIDSILKVF
eukprot:GHVP01024167.1.p1 GENE.GHVP01024167.1~~GHVP01024167.1.p1  ORF type:complete len:340 (-),score=83.84 GHVP01024167.1:169-1188(-)